jgi:hypothetical protein
MTSLLSRHDRTLQFTCKESVVLFLEGLRALNLYEKETLKFDRSAKQLKDQLKAACDKLEECVLVYKEDKLPYFYAGIALALRNQQDNYLKELTKDEQIKSMKALGSWLVFRKEEASRASETPNVTGLPASDMPAKAVPSFEREATKARKEAEKFLDLAHQDWEMLRKAIICFEHVRGNGPDELENAARYNIAQVYARLGRPQDLEKALAELTEPDKYLEAKNSSHPDKEVAPQRSFDLWSRDDEALAIQAKTLRLSLLARKLISETEPSFRASEKFQGYWQELKGMPEKMESMFFDAGALRASFRRDLRADWLLKSGYVQLDQAIANQFTNDPLQCLDRAEKCFADALKLRACWNQAQLYLAVVQTVQSGVQQAQAKVAERIFAAKNPKTASPEAAEKKKVVKGFNDNAETFVERALELFASLTGIGATENPAAEPAPAKKVGKRRKTKRDSEFLSQLSQT